VFQSLLVTFTLIFPGKAGRLRVEVTESDKHTSLLWSLYITNLFCFIVQAPRH